MFVSIHYKLSLVSFQTVPVQGTSNLLTYIEASQLTSAFGGSLAYDHKAWIRLQKVSNSAWSLFYNVFFVKNNK